MAEKLKAVGQVQIRQDIVGRCVRQAPAMETVKAPRPEGGCCLSTGAEMQELENDAVRCEIILDCGGGHLKAEIGGGDVTDKQYTKRATVDLGWSCRAGEAVGAARRAVCAFVIVLVRAGAGREQAGRDRSGVLPAYFAV